MKKLLATIVVLLAAKHAFACDAAIQQFSRDCSLQDRMAKVRADYARLGLDVDEIGDYKVIRFIDRGSWERAKLVKKAPLDIYDPAPATWQVWEKGIDSLFKNRQLKDALMNGSVILNQDLFSRINYVLLTDGTTSIKDKNTAQNKKPGEFRHNMDGGVGFCAGNENARNYRDGIRKSEDSMERYQERWESLMQTRFRDIVKKEDGPNWRRADLKSGMNVSDSTCRGGSGVFISYSDSAQVERQIDWIRIFIKTNLEAFQRGEAKISPIELAAVVQKWFVSVHPFADGNGRTSRGVEDFILANFGLPYAPGGDLQNDAMEDVTVYIENSYKKTEEMISKLEECVTKRDAWRIPRSCRTIDELNKNSLPDEDDKQVQQMQNAGG